MTVTATESPQRETAAVARTEQDRVRKIAWTQVEEAQARLTSDIVLWASQEQEDTGTS